MSKLPKMPKVKDEDRSSFKDRLIDIDSYLTGFAFILILAILAKERGVELSVLK